MKSSEHIRRLAGGIRFRPDKEIDERILASAEAALGKRMFPDMEPARMRSIIMRNPMIRIAAAAAVVVACAIGVSLWRGTESGIALADVLARVEQVKVFKCAGSMKITGQAGPGKSYQSETRHTRLTSQDHGVITRAERVDPNGHLTLLGEVYMYPQKRAVILIQHTDKTYTRKELSDAELQRMQKQLSRYDDPGAFLKEIVSCKHASLGRSTVDGIEVEGFGTTDPNYRGAASKNKDPQVDVKVWIDVKKRLPVRYESLTKRLDATGNLTSFHFVMNDFQWDIPVTAAEFEPPVAPEGYVVVVENRLPGPVNEESATQALGQCVELLGKYPGSLTVGLPRGLQVELDKSDSPVAMRLKEELKALTEQERVNRLMDAATPIRYLVEFYARFIDDKKDPAYYGTTITPKDADKILLRWKVSDNEYRVIYGDLHAETVSPEKLSELEKTQPK